MPMALEPGRRYTIVLTTDKHKDTPPGFWYPYLTGRQQQQLMDSYEGIGGAASQADNMRLAFEAAEKYLLGWENMGIEYAPGTLRDVCSVMEAMELVNRLMLQGPDAAEKKS